MWAAQNAAQGRVKVAADFLFFNKRPLDGVLYQLRLPASVAAPHQKRWLQIAWPGVLQLLVNGEIIQSASLAQAHSSMPEYLQHLRTVCPADKVLLKATMRRPHTTPQRLVLDAGGVLHVFHARTDKVLAVSVAGDPYKLSPDFKALSFHDLMPKLR